jgi:fructokinase
MRALSVGEVLWDVFGRLELLGGAALNVCVNLHRCGDTTLLVSGVGEDPRGKTALESIARVGLETSLIEVVPEYSTGTAVVAADVSGEPTFRIPRPSAFDAFTLSSPKIDRIRGFAPDWLYMGTLLQTAPGMESLIAKLREEMPETRCFYDMNLREGHWSLPLVERLCRGVSVLKLNRLEALRLAELQGICPEHFSLDLFCRTWSKRFGIDTICVTLGAEGCCVFANAELQSFPGLRIEAVDTVGAGDAFAAGFLHGLHNGWTLRDVAAFANKLGAFVASRQGAMPAWTAQDLDQLAVEDVERGA